MADSSTPFSVAILSYSRTSGVASRRYFETRFEIEVTDETGAKHKVYKRYRDFLELAASLNFRCGSFGPRLPPKGVLCKLCPSFMAQRVQGLTRYLQALLSCEAALMSKGLQAFLQLPAARCQRCCVEHFKTTSTLDVAHCGRPLSCVDEGCEDEGDAYESDED